MNLYRENRNYLNNMSQTGLSPSMVVVLVQYDHTLMNNLKHMFLLEKVKDNNIVHI